ncbi:MAG: hypothetical protein WBB62_06710, partial [Rhodococcus sp. (in: high G+C Gram-positive bacteria)]
MTDSTRVRTTDLEAALLAWVPQQRWFAAKGSRVVSLAVVARVPLGSRPGVSAEHLLVDIGLDLPGGNGVRMQRYQVPLGFRTNAVDDLVRWQLPLASVDSVVSVVFDGLWDPEIIALYGDALAAAESVESIDFRNVVANSIDHGMLGRVLGAEQSNTSVILGEVLLLKLFRQVSPGVNPDIELHRALAETGCENVAPLRGWL